MRNEREVPGLGTLRYDWHAIGRLVEEFGQDFDAAISKASVLTDIDAIAKAVAIGLGDGISAEDVKRASPPIVPTVQAVMEALNLAFHGQKGAPPADGKAVSHPPRTSLPPRGKRHSAPG